MHNMHQSIQVQIDLTNNGINEINIFFMNKG